MRGFVELWLPNDRFRLIMVALLIASSYLRTSILSVFYDNTKEGFKYYISSIVVHLFPIYQVIFIKINLKIASSKAFVIKMMHLCSFHKHILNLYAHFGAENKSDYVFCDTLLFFASTFSVPTPLIQTLKELVE